MMALCLMHFLCCHWQLSLFLYLWIGSTLRSMVLQPDAVQCKSDRLQCLFPPARLQFALPHRDAVPAHFGQFPLFLLVSLLVSVNLVHPELTVRLWNFAALRTLQAYSPLALWRGVGGEATLVSMPETPIHKDARPVFPQHQIRMSRQPFVVQSESEASTPQSTTHYHLRLRILRLDSRHVFVALLW